MEDRELFEWLSRTCTNIPWDVWRNNEQSNVVFVKINELTRSFKMNIADCSITCIESGDNTFSLSVNQMSIATWKRAIIREFPIGVSDA